VSARLTAVAQDLEQRQRTALGSLGAATEPELDQFMVSSLTDLGINILLDDLLCTCCYITMVTWWILCSCV
jgi:hypothetical protein